MDAALAGKVAVITGASRGIGLAIARALAARGCNLALSARDREALDRAAHDFRVEVLAERCDVRDESSVGAFFSAVRERFARVDILVNNAGNAHPLLHVERIPLKMWRDVIETNLTGTFLCTRAALPLMKAGAAIVNNLSMCAVEVFPQEAAYCAAKYGALGFTNVLREEVRARGIRVIAVMPGATATELWNQFWPDAPRERMMSAETVAKAVVDALSLPPNASVDEIHIGPTAGAL